jgi:hypothetical protein
MYYGFYLFAIALVVMVGQLAFALYQVASLFCHEQEPPRPLLVRSGGDVRCVGRDLRDPGYLKC